MYVTTQIMNAVEDRFEGDFKQDLYIKIMELEDDKAFETDEDLQKWLSTLAKNQYGNDTWVEQNRQRLMEENDSTIRDTYGYNDTAADPLDIILAEELEDTMLASLSDLEMDIYARVLGNGVPYKDVAKELDMSEEAVRKHVSRIKRKFIDE